MLRYNLCGYDSDICITVKGTIIVEGDDDDDQKLNIKLTFKNNPPFISCISKINNTSADIAEDLDAVMPMYNLLEYNDIHSMISGSLWRYY